MTSQLKIDENLICPYCSADNLLLEEKAVVCRSCNSRYCVENGIYIFTDKDYYFGEIDREDMRRILKRIKKDIAILNSIKAGEAIEDVKIGEFLVRYIFSEHRASYIDFLLKNYGYPKKRTSLDIGCGYGLIGSVMEKKGFKNYYVDLTIERLEFARIRNEFLGHSSGVYILGGDRNIPVKDGSVGILLCIGVLEWVPSSISDETPEETQARFLRHLFSKVEPGGYMILGIENRYAYRYLLGGRDDHTGIRFVTFLPRFLANFYSKVIGKGNYRNYLYSYNGLKKLIKRAGFSEIEIFYPHKDYRFANHTVCFDNHSEIEKLLRESGEKTRGIYRAINTGLRLLNLLNLYKYFAYSFIAIAKK